jgi:hypothetical protein
LRTHTNSSLNGVFSVLGGASFHLINI